MSHPVSSSRFSRGALGQVAVGVLLAGLALGLLAWQKGELTWGEPGSERVMTAFAVTLVYSAWCAWLWQARRKLPGTSSAATGAPDAQSPALLLIHASQTGYAEQLAEQTALSLRTAGVVVDLRSIADIDAATLLHAQRALFIASTTGEGDAPDCAARFLHDPGLQGLSLNGLRYGVLALGDSEYVNYCGFGHHLDQWLRQRGAQALFDTIEVDNGEQGALRHWQHQFGVLAGSADIVDWQAPSYSRWRLLERRLLNPGSVGDPCFHLSLEPCERADLQWRAGDIAEIGPRNAALDVAALLAARGLDATAMVDAGAGKEALIEVLARSYLPSPTDAPGADAQGVAAILKPLPHREYSIASIPSDGAVHLLVRLMRRADGRLGIGSGWLAENATIGSDISLRIRSNTNFHVPPDARPMVLIGNGTGLAGLRSLLKQRIANGQHRNWLIFGERNRAHDFYHRDEIEGWLARGMLERVDLAFSRDQAARIYVQDKLREAAPALREWVAQGASIHVCGSLDGMAPGVDAALRAVLGGDLLERMMIESRYRRDVY